jgi:hypothetical protein
VPSPLPEPCHAIGHVPVPVTISVSIAIDEPPNAHVETKRTYLEKSDITQERIAIDWFPKQCAMNNCHTL